MRRLIRHVFTFVSMLLLLLSVVVAGMELTARVVYGGSAYAPPEGMRLFIGQKVPYRWPVAPWEVWESEGPLGFKAGTFWIGGVRSG